MIKLINKTNEQINFTSDMPISLVNAIRRTVNKIPILAIDSLEISKNDSALYDEMISHRLGLIPLKNEKLKAPEECDCGKDDGCSKCSIKVKLSATGPCIVYSDQLTPRGSIVYKMPITILDKSQELEFIAVARVGIGERHAKYSPGLFYYKYSEDLEKEDDDSFKKLVDESKKKKNKEIIITIESWGQITLKDIFIQSAETLVEEVKDFLKKIK